jgi:hypothetical protein
VQDYFNYFTEIEERFCQRRGTIVLLSTLDWALIETWKDSGIPLEAVLRGIDASFDHYDARPSRTRKVNSLAYCAQEVLAAAEDMREAAIGKAPAESPQSGFEPLTVAAFLERNAATLEQRTAGSSSDGSSQASIAGANMSSRASAAGASRGTLCSLPPSTIQLVQESARTLNELAQSLKATKSSSLEDLERRLTVMEEKLFAGLLAATPDEQLVTVRAEADRELAPYRRKMIAAQIDHLHKQYVHKRLLERYGIPRLSLFYM